MQAAGVFMRQAGCLSANWWGCRARVRVYTRVFTRTTTIVDVCKSAGHTAGGVCAVHGVSAKQRCLPLNFGLGFLWTAGVIHRAWMNLVQIVCCTRDLGLTSAP
jgi:hypothetical protein